MDAPPQSARSFQRQTISDQSGVTYASQSQLPRLPIPDLAETLLKFQARLEALQDEAQRDETERVTHEFLHGDGPKLQTLLQRYEVDGFQSSSIGSYVEEFWDESYLSPDASVVLNLNPFFVLEGGPDPKTASDPLRRAASLCYASLKMASMLKHETLTPDAFRGTSLCMDQFKALFSSSRQPSKNDSDDVHVFTDSTHVVVLCQNQFYYFSALWPDTFHVAVDEADLVDIFGAIRKHAALTSVAERSQTAIGVLTSLPRSKWAVARENLCRLDSNATALRVVDSSLFILVLDDCVPGDIHTVAANMLHGVSILNGPALREVGSCLNRWHDKLQLIICADGTSGLSFEHSIIDGHTALRFVADIYSETIISFAESIVDLIHGRGRITHVVNAIVDRAANAACRSKVGGGRSLNVLPKKLVFDLSEHMLDQIYHAETALCDEIHSSDTHVLEFHEYGKRLIVANNISPDAFVQMSILLAYYKLYGRVDCMYEPALTKQFFHGRTEAIRGTTPQAKELCRVWCDRTSTAQQKLESLRRATVEHSRLTKEASSGHGVDRHLFALKSIALRQGLPLPPFFQSEAWRVLNHTIISTSNCGNPALRLFGFGPVVPDGFGIGYIIKDDAISYSVSSKQRKTRRYVHSLQQCLQELNSLLEPISFVAVQRPTLSRVRDVMIKEHQSSVAYGDIWGESNVPDEVPLQATATQERSSSQYFSRVFEHNIQANLFDVPNITVLLDNEVIAPEGGRPITSTIENSATSMTI